MNLPILRAASLRARLAKRSERGMTTAEYAVGTVAVVLAGGVVTKCVTDDWFRELIIKIIMALLAFIFAQLGIPFPL